MRNNTAEPVRCAVIVYFDVPIGCDSREIKDWIEYVLKFQKPPINKTTWKGMENKANFHIELIKA